MIWMRSLLFAAWFYLWSAMVAIAITPLLLFPRAWMRAGFRVWAASTAMGLRVICGIKVEIRGREHVPKGPALIAAKHQCMLDTITPFHTLPDACLVMKQELTRIPFYGWFARKARMIVVDRDAAAQALRKLVSEAETQLAAGRQILIFPEGTRTAPGAAADYKPGVAGLYRDLQIPCTPMATNSGVHWPAHGFLRRPGTVVFEYLEPIPAGLKRGAFMAELTARIETASKALLEEGV